jgi:hypothetical protein
MAMTARSAGLGAVVVTLHAIAFFVIAWAITLWRNNPRRQAA